MHISLGALVSTWLELLLEMIADVAPRDPAFGVANLPGALTERGRIAMILRLLRERVMIPAHSHQMIIGG